jgi:hypothetical protein
LALISDPKNLLKELQVIGIYPSVIREVLQAYFGVKVSRTSISDRQLPCFVAVIESYGMYIGVSQQKYFASPDTGKGGWCNAPPIILEGDSQIGEHFIYIGKYPEKVLLALQSEESGFETSFAESLGIPKCCSEFYLKEIESARRVQNDLLPFSFKNSSKIYPLDFWTNMASQYFGYGLNSFFPCSFNCPNSSDVALQTFELLKSVDLSFAELFYRHQKMNYLYTEYDGVFAFYQSTFDKTILCYEPLSIIGTCNGVVMSALKRGDSIAIIDERHYQVLSEERVLLDLKDEFTALLIFSPT